MFKEWKIFSSAYNSILLSSLFLCLAFAICIRNLAKKKIKFSMYTDFMIYPIYYNKGRKNYLKGNFKIIHKDLRYI